MNPLGIFERRVRGFRVVEVGGAVVLIALALTVYLAKTGAGAKRADIDRIQTQIETEQTQIRLLKAEVATLEQPERLESLSQRYLGLVPVSARREVTPEALADVARGADVGHPGGAAVSDPITQAGSPDVPAPPAGGPKAASTAPGSR